MLSQEVSKADHSRNYALYIDGDIAKLPGGGRKGAAVLCELVPSQIQGRIDPNFIFTGKIQFEHLSNKPV
jgi:hypothetical protein